MTLTVAETKSLIEEHLPLVNHVLFQTAAHYPRHADRQELAQAATLGLVESAHRFDPDRGVPFARWAAVRIRGAIVDAVRAIDFAPRSLRAAARDLEDARTSLLGRLGRIPTAGELAGEMHIPLAELHELQAKVHRALVLSLDAPCGTEEGDSLTLADGLVECSDTNPQEILEERELRTYLGDALNALPEQLRAVVTGYFMQGRTSADLAEEFAVTESRVSQMRSQALALMRAGIEAQYAEAPRVGLDSGAGRAAERRAAYAAAVAAQSSFADRLSGQIPAQRGPDLTVSA